jgi:hypothetical protein
MAVLYALMGLLFVPFFLFVGSFAPAAADDAGFGFSTGFALFLPVLYGGFGFVFTLIAAALYNLVAGFVGGIEVELEGAPIA